MPLIITERVRRGSDKLEFEQPPSRHSKSKNALHNKERLPSTTHRATCLAFLCKYVKMWWLVEFIVYLGLLG